MLFSSLTDDELFNMFTYHVANYATAHNLTSEDTRCIVQVMGTITNLIDGFKERIDCQENIVKALRYYDFDNVEKSVNRRSDLMDNFVEQTFVIAHHAYLRSIIDQNLRITKPERKTHE